jgi:hypothetical protein
VTEQILSPHLDTVNFYSHTDSKNVGGSGRAAQFLFPFGFPFVLHSTFFSTYAAGRRACAHSWRSRLSVCAARLSLRRAAPIADRPTHRVRQAKPQSVCLEVDFSQARSFFRAMQFLTFVFQFELALAYMTKGCHLCLGQNAVKQQNQGDWWKKYHGNRVCGLAFVCSLILIS